MKLRRITVNNETTTWTMEYEVSSYANAPEGTLTDSEALQKILQQCDPGDYYVVRFEPFELGRIREDRAEH